MKPWNDLGTILQPFQWNAAWNGKQGFASNGAASRWNDFWNDPRNVPTNRSTPPLKGGRWNDWNDSTKHLKANQMNHDDNQANIIDNAVHAAGAWLQRIGEAPDTMAVITLHPRASLGIWRTGSPNVSTFAQIDDAGADMCEAAAPLAQQAIEKLAPGVRNAMPGAVERGARLQLLITPLSGTACLRMHDGAKCEVLATLVSGLDA